MVAYRTLGLCNCAICSEERGYNRNRSFDSSGSDMVLRGGENVSCTEVENALCEYPAVLEAAVFGVPDERLGEVVWAEVAINPSVIPQSGEVDGRELSAYLAGRIADFKIPARIRIRRHRLERGATEKIDKRRIRARAIEESLEQSREEKATDQTQLEHEQADCIYLKNSEPAPA